MGHTVYMLHIFNLFSFLLKHVLFKIKNMTGTSATIGQTTLFSINRTFRQTSLYNFLGHNLDYFSYITFVTLLGHAV